MPVLSTVLLLSAVPAFAAEVSVTEKGHASNPTWSADGSQLAFEINDYGGNISMYAAKVQNGNPMGTPSQVKLPHAASSFGGGGSVAANATWLQDGMMFEGSTAGGTMRLYYWTPSGSMAGEFLENSKIGGDLTWPAASADGNFLAFVSDATGKGDIYVWDASTNEIKQMLQSPFTESAPRYHRDGQTLAFSRKNQGGEDLFTVSGGTTAPLVGGNGDQSRPVYSSGGEVVFFTSERGDGHWDIAVSSGPGQKKVIAKDIRLPVRAPPALSPDGQWVAYGADNPDLARFIFFTKLDGSATVKYDTQLVAAGEPALTSSGGRTFLAFTALPSAGADWRQLHIADVSGKGPQ
jgi:Tol biopolymer transport system component